MARCAKAGSRDLSGLRGPAAGVRPLRRGAAARASARAAAAKPRHRALLIFLRRFVRPGLRAGSEILDIGPSRPATLVVPVRRDHRIGPLHGGGPRSPPAPRPAASAPSLPPHGRHPPPVPAGHVRRDPLQQRAARSRRTTAQSSGDPAVSEARGGGDGGRRRAGGAHDARRGPCGVAIPAVHRRATWRNNGSHRFYGRDFPRHACTGGAHRAPVRSPPRHRAPPSGGGTGSRPTRASTSPSASPAAAAAFARAARERQRTFFSLPVTVRSTSPSRTRE